MANINCLENVRCPKCGQEDRFLISALVQVEVTDEGTQGQGTDYEWGNENSCTCPMCDHTGVLRDFNTVYVLTEPAIERRIERAEKVLSLYRGITGADSEEIETVIYDLMADLFHYAVKGNKDDAESTVEELIRLARLHFDAEHAGDDL